MRLDFISASLIFSILNLFLLYRFVLQKEKVALRTTITSLGFVWLITVSVSLWGVTIPFGAFLFVLATSLVNSYFGYYRNLYNKSRRFDRLSHCLGTFSSAIFFFYLLSNFLKYGGSKAFMSVYILLLGISIGTVYEIYEFLADLKKREGTQKLQHGLRDTNMDLTFNMIGSVCASVLYALLY